MESGDTRSVLLSTELEKDLGVNMDPSLKFSKHTEIKVNKANRILGLIRRSYEFLDGESLKRLYMALVRPHLDYCNSVCFPRLIKDKKLLEGVQRRATKLIPDLSNLPYEERLTKLDMPSLQYRRLRGDMIEVYKIVHGFYGVSVDVLPRETATLTRGHTFKLKKRYCRTATRQAFFSYRVVDAWNSLPNFVVTAPSINSFKSRLDSRAGSG